MRSSRRLPLAVRLSLGAIALLWCALPLRADEEHFPQQLAWKADRNALEYRVEIAGADGGEPQFIRTEETKVQISLPAGSWKYRVYAYDVLGRESSVSEWTAFEILQANAPEIEEPEPVAPLSADGKSLELDVPIANVTAASTVELVNADTGKTLKGTLVVADSGAAAGSEVAQATRAQFANVGEGTWKLRVTNPSGLSSESDAFEVKDVQKAERLAREATEKEAAEKAAAEEAERRRAEQERLAAEKAAKEAEAREREEAEKRAREEKLAKEKAWPPKLDLPYNYRSAKAPKPLKGADVHLLAGLALVDNATGGAIGDYSDNATSLMPTLRLSYIPGRVGQNGRVGLESCIKLAEFAEQTEFYDTTLTLGFLQTSLVYQHRLSGERLFAAAKLGGGVAALVKDVRYTYAYGNRDQPEEQVFAYPVVQGGLSLFWAPFQHLVLEAGIDLDHIVHREMPSLIVTPYACIGLRL